MLFNPDMDQRLADLHRALTNGGTVELRRHASFTAPQGSQSDRIWLDIVGTERRLVFDLPTALGLADQLAINGFKATAGQIRAAAT